MIFFIVKWTIFSLVLITLVHHLYNFFQGTLTVPKTRDLVYRPAARYEAMLSTVNKAKSVEIHSPIVESGRENMRDELAAFLQDLKKSNTNAQVLPANSGLSSGTTAI